MLLYRHKEVLFSEISLRLQHIKLGQQQGPSAGACEGRLPLSSDHIDFQRSGQTTNATEAIQTCHREPVFCRMGG